MSRRIFGIGETVLDILFKETQPFAAKVGGSVLNALVSLARTDCEVHFISEIGDDNLGDITIDFLAKNNVNTQYVHRYEQCQTSVALAFLNHNNDAQYQFYKNLPPQRAISLPENITTNDIVLFGSSFAIHPLTKPIVQQFIHEAKNAGAIILYDPNYRKAHTIDEPTKQSFFQYMAMADIVRGSDEDFTNLLNELDISKQLQTIREYCQNAVVTANSKGVFVNSPNVNLKFKVDTISPLSTVGAGDNFNAGLIKGIIDMEITKQNIYQLTNEQWEKLVVYGNSFAQTVCESIDNYVDDGFSERLQYLTKRNLTQY